MEPYFDNTINPKHVLMSRLIARSVTKDDRLVIMLHGWGADSSDLASLAPSLLGSVSSALEIRICPS